MKSHCSWLKQSIAYLLIVFPFLLQGQTKDTVYFHFIATPALDQDGGPVEYVLPVGRNVDLTEEEGGSARALYPVVSTDNDSAWTWASILMTDENSAIIRPDADLTSGGIQGNILTAFFIELPKISHHSIFFRLEQLGVELLNGFEEPFYSLDKVLFEDGKDFEQEILNAGLEDIRMVAEAVQDQGKGLQIEEGRYRGKNLFEVMDNVTAKDLNGFFNYVLEKPFKYQGKAWKLAEVFATWASEGAPSSETEVREIALAAENKAEMEEAFVLVHPLLLDEWAGDWATDATEFAESGNIPLAEKEISLALHAVDYLQLWDKKAVVLGDKGTILSLQGDFEGSEAAFREGISLAQQQEATVTELMLWVNMTNMLNEHQDFKTAEKAIENGIGLVRDMETDETREALAEIAGLCYRHQGDALKGRKKWKKALSSYESGLEYLVLTNSLRSWIRRGAIYQGMLECYEALKNDEKMKWADQKLEEVYEEMATLLRD